MKLGDIYRKIVDMGIEADPRGREVNPEFSHT
jgi:hypothetical protein